MAAFEATIAGRASVYLDQSAFLDIIDHYLAQGQPDAALKACQQALTQYHYSSDFYLRQAQLLARAQRFPQAHAALDQAEIYSPSDEELSLCRAEIFIMQGLPERGFAILDPLLTTASPELRADIYTLRSLAYEAQTNFADAFRALEKALGALPSHEEALERFANCMVLSERYADAAAVLRMVIDDDPYNWRAWFYLGEAVAELNQDYEALEAYEYAFLIQPDFEEAYFGYAELCFANALYEKALETYREIADRFTADGLLLQRQGSCLLQLEQYTAARQQLQHAARLEPHNDEIIYQIASCYAAQAQWRRAYNSYQQAIRMAPEREEYHRGLAQAAYELGKVDEAELAYRDALLLGPDNYESWLDLAWLLLETGRAHEAVEILTEANELLIVAELQYSYIAVLLATGRRQQALLKLGEVLAQDYTYHHYLFDWLPETRQDPDVLALLALHQPPASQP